MRAPMHSAPPEERGGEVLGRATRSAAPTSPAVTAAVPGGFSDVAVWSGLTLPTAIAFAPGKVFVGEKSGVVKVFDSLSDASATQVVDLHGQVQDFSDRGLLGLAVDPGVRRPAVRQLRGRAGPPDPYLGVNNPPNAVATASPTSGPAPLTVRFNGSGSSDPDGDAISYAWDRVADARGASSLSAPITITVGAGNTAPHR